MLRARVYPRRGLCLGLGFPWDATHTQTLETALHVHKRLPTGTDPARGYPALHAVGVADERPLILPWEDLGGHTLITGTTGSGKTRLLEVLATEAIAGPGPVLVFDMKGERELLLRCAYAARQAGKPFALFSTAFPARSARLNLLGTARTTAEVSARIRALMPSAGGRTNEPFFEEFPLAIIERFAAALQAIGLPWTLRSLWGVATMTYYRQRLLHAYLRHLGADVSRQAPLRDVIRAYRRLRQTTLLAESLIEDNDWPAEHYRKVTSSLVPAFRGVIEPPIGPLLSALPPDLTWPQMVRDETVVYVALASLMLGDIANRIGRAILQDFIGFLGRRYAYEDCSQATPITAIVDELRQTLYPNFTTALAMGRGAGARFLLAQQSMADAEYALGKPASRVMAANINTKIWMRLADDDDSATVATEGLDTCMVTLPDTSVGVGYGGMGGLTGHAQHREVQREVPLVRPHWLTALPAGQGYARLKGSIWKFRVPLLTPPPEEPLAEDARLEPWLRLPDGRGPVLHPETALAPVSTLDRLLPAGPPPAPDAVPIPEEEAPPAPETAAPPLADDDGLEAEVLDYIDEFWHEGEEV